MMNKDPAHQIILNQLEKALKKIFDPKRVANNYKLQSILSKQQFVPIDDLIHFPRVAEITEDIDTLLEAVRNCSDKLTLDENNSFVVPKFETCRTTLILRDLPGDATLEEIKDLFDNSECSRVKEIVPEVNQTWFVEFYNEEDCIRTCTWVQTQARFRGQKVRCRIKSEHQTKHMFPNATNNTPPSSTQSAPASQAAFFNDPAVAFYGPPKTKAHSVEYGNRPTGGQEFMDFINRQLSQEHPMPLTHHEPRGVPRRHHSYDSHAYHHQNQEPFNPRSYKRQPSHDEPQEFDETIDYMGIFKSINKKTFDMVIERFHQSYPNGVSPPQTLFENDILLAEEYSPNLIIDPTVEPYT